MRPPLLDADDVANIIHAIAKHKKISAWRSPVVQKSSFESIAGLYKDRSNEK